MAGVTDLVSVSEGGGPGVTVKMAALLVTGNGASVQRMVAALERSVPWS